jgi:hypothetical protein
MKLNNKFYDDWLIVDFLNETLNIKNIVSDVIKNKDPISLNNKSTVGEESKQYNLDNILNQEIVNIIKDRVIFNLKKIDIEVSLSLKSAWTVLGNKNSYHVLHKHNKKINHISTILYLAAPDFSEKEKGNFYCVLKEKDEIEYYSHSPKIGDMLIFPVWLWHGTYPQENGLRQSLNLDFEINEFK